METVVIPSQFSSPPIAAAFISYYIAAGAKRSSKSLSEDKPYRKGGWRTVAGFVPVAAPEKVTICIARENINPRQFLKKVVEELSKLV